jgi:hypothetical protein
MEQGKGGKTAGDGTNDRKGIMISMQSEQAQPQTYVMYDAIGRPIGRVVQPKHEPAVGPGQETVLLVRAS